MIDDYLEKISSELRGDFDEKHPQISFNEYLKLVEANPTGYLRNSVQYLRDCFLYFGMDKNEEGTKFHLFNASFDQNADRLIGQVHSQTQVFRLLEGFIREGAVNKLILLHGPNGSAKSTFVNTMMAALEAYSHTDEGALYRFNWVFPLEKIISKSSIGFGGEASLDPNNLETFAYLSDAQVDAKIQSDMNDHPLLLIPQIHRKAFCEDLLKSGSEKEEGFVLSDYLAFGDLSHTSRQIFNALFASYEGDLSSLLKHVQAERFYISRRYREAAVSVEPQMRVDAGLRQLTADRSLSALPIILQNKTLFEPFGDLVDANRGVIQYEDFLKRHPDLNKYLLSTAEKGTVSLDSRILYLDMVLIATANETYLDAFKQTADYTSFKGRVEFVRFPYLLSYLEEKEIYDEQVVKLKQHVAPHTTLVTALWAVLTRFHRPQVDLYEKEIKDLITKLTPLEKADLYASKITPSRLTAEEARELVELRENMKNESTSLGAYEGRFGASPREMKVMLLSASQNSSSHLSPIDVFKELGKLVAEPNVYPFLQMKEDGLYRKPEEFIAQVQERYLDIIDLEIRSAMSLVDDQQYRSLFERYVKHVSHSKSGEKVFNATLKTYVEPDEKLMTEVESYFQKEIGPSFREDIISTIAAWSIENGTQDAIRYKEVFPQLFKSMHSFFFEGRWKTIQKNIQDIIFSRDERVTSLSKAELENAEEILSYLAHHNGYTRDSAFDVIAFLYSERYRNQDKKKDSE